MTDWMLRLVLLSLLTLIPLVRPCVAAKGDDGVQCGSAKAELRAGENDAVLIVTSDTCDVDGNCETKFATLQSVAAETTDFVATLTFVVSNDVPFHLDCATTTNSVVLRSKYLRLPDSEEGDSVEITPHSQLSGRIVMSIHAQTTDDGGVIRIGLQQFADKHGSCFAQKGNQVTVKIPMRGYRCEPPQPDPQDPSLCVFHLNYADPFKVITIIRELFGDQYEPMQIYSHRMADPSKATAKLKAKAVQPAETSPALTMEAEIDIPQYEFVTIAKEYTDDPAKKLYGDVALSTSTHNAIAAVLGPVQRESLSNILGQLDRRPVRIELQVRVCEFDCSDVENLGLAIDKVLGQTWTERPEGFWQISDNDDNVDDGYRLTWPSFRKLQLDRSGLTINAWLNLMIQEERATLLANPTLATVDGQQASYFAGQHVPYQEWAYSETGSGLIPGEIEYQDIGIVLNFLPRVSYSQRLLSCDAVRSERLGQAEDLTIDIRPIINTIVTESPAGVDYDIHAPVVATRQLQTVVRVKDGETFMLAGLLTTEEREALQKVPILGDLPLLGKLFRNKKSDLTTSEIIIIVTPHIIGECEDSSATRLFEPTYFDYSGR